MAKHVIVVAALGLAVAAGAAGEESEMREQTLMVPMKVEYQAAWLTWVASTTTCLNALGVDCDNADVAGYSGYAFHLCTHPELCPSGPTVLDLDKLAAGVRALGRATAQFHGGEGHHTQHKNDRTRVVCRAAFEFARREIQAGRPCVMNGAYLPEFAAVRGVSGDTFILSSFKGPDAPPLPFDEIDAPGGPYILAFPAECEVPAAVADRTAIVNAIDAWQLPPHGLYRYGADAYDLWIESLEAKRAGARGAGYNSQCYAEARRFARDFFARMALREPHAKAELEEVSALYGKAAAALGKVAELCPFQGAAWDAKIEDDETIAAVVAELKKAKAAESGAIEILREVAVMEWPQPQR